MKNFNFLFFPLNKKIPLSSNRGKGAETIYVRYILYVVPEGVSMSVTPSSAR